MRVSLSFRGFEMSMNPVVKDVADALTAAGYSNIRAYGFDESSASQIAIFPAGGSDVIVSGGDVAKPRVQIQVRRASLETAQTDALDIRDALHKMTAFGHSVAMIWEGGHPTHYVDEVGRHVFVIDFRVIRCIAD